MDKVSYELIDHKGQQTICEDIGLIYEGLSIVERKSDVSRDLFINKIKIYNELITLYEETNN